MVLCQLDEWMHDYNELAPQRLTDAFFKRIYPVSKELKLSVFAGATPPPQDALKVVIALNLQDAELPLPCSPSSRKPVTEPAATSNGQAEASCLTPLTMKTTFTANAAGKDKRTKQEHLPATRATSFKTRGLRSGHPIF